MPNPGATTVAGLSALVVVRNEERILADCLDRLGFAAEVVVVLDRCTDACKEIALAKGARIVEGAWEIEGARRHAGIDACGGPWVLEIDADEWVSPELAREIAATVGADSADFYFLPIANHVHGRWIKGGWMAALAPDWRGSLFRKGAKTWGMQRVHPAVDFTGRRGEDLKSPLQHNFAADISTLMRRFDRNTTLRAEDMAATGEIGRTRNMARKAISRFWKCYVARGGIREGGIGFLISLLSAIYPLVSHLKATEIAGRQAQPDVS